MVRDAQTFLRTGNVALTASETPETHYIAIPPSALRKNFAVEFVFPLAPTGSPTSITYELQYCQDANDPTQHANWSSFNPPLVYTQDLTRIHVKHVWVHPLYGYLGLKTTVTGGTNPSAGNVVAAVVPGTTGAGFNPPVNP